MNKGTEIDHVIAYLEKRKSEGYTHVAVTTPDKEYDSIVYYDECSRKDEGVLTLIDLFLIMKERWKQNARYSISRY